MNARYYYFGALAAIVAWGAAVGGMPDSRAVASPSDIMVSAGEAANLQASIDTIAASTDELMVKLGGMRAELREIKIEFDNLGQRIDAVTSLQDGMAKLLHGEIVAIASELEEVALRLNAHGAGQMMSFARMDAFEPALIETAAIPSPARVSGHVLGVGESIDVEGRNVFVSYLTETDGVFFVDRSERAQAGGGHGALALGNGCSVALNGVHGGKAIIRTTCM